ncbi:hypothetical protein QYF36_000205 [Acer negundo]|nr:hypothetical protein QYF36_000205 [Acer negundo]
MVARGDLGAELPINFCRFPLKAVKVMHTVSLRTEATIPGGTMPPNLGQAFKKQGMVKDGEEVELVQSGIQC